MQKKPTKYFLSDGTPVKKKCVEEKICYFSVIKYISRGLTPDEAFERAKITKSEPYKFFSRLYYKDKPLKQYCKENNIKYSKILSRIYRKMMTVEQAIEWKK